MEGTPRRGRIVRPRRSLRIQLDLEQRCAELAERGWSLQPGALDSTSCALLRRSGLRRRALGSFRPAGVGRGAQWRLRPELRGDEVAWVDTATSPRPQRELLESFLELRSDLNERLLLGLSDYEAHLAVYPVGTFYARHRDHFAGTTSRVLTTTLYLNEDWNREDGGQIRLYLPDGEIEIPPFGGTLLLFLSQEFEHEVLPAKRERWSWTGWYRRREG